MSCCDECESTNDIQTCECKDTTICRGCSECWFNNRTVYVFANDLCHYVKSCTTYCIKCDPTKPKNKDDFEYDEVKISHCRYCGYKYTYYEYDIQSYKCGVDQCHHCCMSRRSR